MTKAELVGKICERVGGLARKDAADLLETFFEAMKDTLERGETLKISGFGNFVVRSKGARKGRNPRAGEEIGITPRRVVTFRPSQVFKKYVNS